MDFVFYVILYNRMKTELNERISFKNTYKYT